MNVPYVHSNYERIADDNYQTVDPRCVRGLVESIEIRGTIVDICAPNGSKIVDHLTELGYTALGYEDAYIDRVWGNWIVTNTPFKKGIVDAIVSRQIHRVKTGEVFGFAALLRTNFDHAKSRKSMFKNEHYYGQVKLCFRPYWTEERKHSPIHNYVWHIWSLDAGEYPRTLYWYED